jgi:hypothetical protein
MGSIETIPFIGGIWILRRDVSLNVFTTVNKDSEMHIDLQLPHEQATKPTAERNATSTFSIESSEDSLPCEIVLEYRSDSTISPQHQPMMEIVARILNH